MEYQKRLDDEVLVCESVDFDNTTRRPTLSTQPDEVKYKSWSKMFKKNSDYMQEYDTYQIEFRLSQAIKANIIHFTHLFLGPFSLPILYLLFGRYLMRNMMFKLHIMYFTGELPQFIWLIFSIAFVSEQPERLHDYGAFISATLGVVALKTMLISSKYGYFTQKHWKELGARDMPSLGIRSHLLLWVWLIIPARVAEREIINSYRRFNMNPALLFIVLKRPLPDECYSIINSFMPPDPNYIPLATGECRMSNLSISRLLFARIRKNASLTPMILVVLCAGLYGLIPHLIMFGQKHLTYFEGGWLTYFFLVTSTLLCWFVSFAFISYIYVGIYDFNRKRLLMKECTSLISEGYEESLNLLSQDKSNPAKLDFTDHFSIISWYYLRRSFMDFGKGFTLRIHLYTSLVTPLCGILIVLLALQSLNLIDLVQYLLIFTPEIALTFMVLFVITYMALTGVLLNNHFATHRDILWEKISKIRKKIYEKKGKENLLDSIGSIEFVVNMLYQDEALRPVTVMGVTVNSGVILKVLSLIFTGAIAVLKIVFG
ncbi:unnamed protein product [Blepharisma stoltei]|uniref:Odorant receptor n=1 Tax=Blepharisma stoltei TaxID=1481888 RepID=A0AAU9JB40_9CILI|nr:unnamed protein product [Blepharisma stoltei]